METLLTSQVFGRLSEAAQTLANQEVRLWKEQGGRVIGYFCSSVPEEVFTAAGFLPFRMRATGSSGTEMSDAFFSSINCSFPRHCFNQALKGEFGFLDGLVLYNSCDNVRRVYDHWIRQMDTPFVHFMSIPRRRSSSRYHCTCSSSALLGMLMKWTKGVSICRIQWS